MRFLTGLATATVILSTFCAACSDDSSLAATQPADEGTVSAESAEPAIVEPASSASVPSSTDSSEPASGTAEEPSSNGSSSPSSSGAAEPASSGSTPLSSTGTEPASSAAEQPSDTPASSATDPESSASEDGGFYTANWREGCLDKINEYRATEGLKPLTLAPEAKQTCTDNQAAEDMAKNAAHGHFGDCGEFAQNSGPNFNTSWMKDAATVSDYYLEMMWDEKKLVESGERDPASSEDYPYIGHYLNMKGSYTQVACGIALSSDGKKGWFNVNFF